MTAVPAPHSAFLASTIEHLAADPRIVGLAVGGSYLAGTMDAFSDLDLVIVVDPAHNDQVLAERRTIAESLGTLLAAFVGDHVGEPRLLICLYDDPILHVDLKFVKTPDLSDRVEDPSVAWERDGLVTAALSKGEARYPQPDRQWIEDRFWVWVHYMAGKIGRGELFEVIDGLGFLRSRILGPLALVRAGERPMGVRKIERFAPDIARDLEKTLATHEARSCADALRATVALYRELRSPSDLVLREAAELASVRYLASVMPITGATVEDP